MTANSYNFKDIYCYFHYYDYYYYQPQLERPLSNLMTSQPQNLLQFSKDILQSTHFNNWKFDHSMVHILHEELHWLDIFDRVFFKQALTVHQCLNGRALPYLSDYCIPVTGADTWWNLCSANCQLLAVPRFWLNTYGRQPFSCRPNSLELSPIFHLGLGNQCRLQNVSDVYLKRNCSLYTSAFSGLKVLNDNCTL